MRVPREEWHGWAKAKAPQRRENGGESDLNLVHLPPFNSLSRFYMCHFHFPFQVFSSWMGEEIQKRSLYLAEIIDDHIQSGSKSVDLICKYNIYLSIMEDISSSLPHVEAMFISPRSIMS